MDGGGCRPGRGGVYPLKFNLPGQNQRLHISRKKDFDYLQSGSFSEVWSYQGVALAWKVGN